MPETALPSPAAGRPAPLSARPPRWHTALYLVALAVAALEVSVPGDGTPLAARLVVWACVAAAVPGVLWRTTRPWLLPVAGIVAAAAGPTTLLGMGLFSAALRRRDRTTLLLAVLGALALLTPWSLGYSGTMEWSSGDVVLEPAAGLDIALTWLTRAALVCGVSLGLGGYLGARRDLLASLRDRADRAEAERELRAGQAVLQERERISREMHDVLGHKLALLAMQAGALEVGAPTEQVRADAVLLRTTARDALADLRAVVHALEEPGAGAPIGGAAGAAGAGAAVAGAGAAGGVADVPLRPQAGLTDVGTLVAAYRESGARVTLRDEASPTALAEPPAADVGRAAHRVVQEALTNAHKHAPGLPVDVTLAGGPGAGLRVEVRNPRPLPGAVRPAGGGAGEASGAPGGGTGLRGLAERVRLAGGSLDAGPDGADFVVRARLPWGA